MKFIVRYRIREYKNGKHSYAYRNKTVQANEINEAIRKFIKEANLPLYTHVTTVRQGRYIYQWHDTAYGAFPANYCTL